MVEYCGHSEREAAKGFYCDQHGKTGCIWYSVELYEYNLSCVVQDRDKSVGGESQINQGKSLWLSFIKSALKSVKL